VVLEEAKMMLDSGNDVFIISLKHNHNLPEIIYLYEGNIKNILLPFKISLSKSIFSKSLNIILSFYNPIALFYLRKILVAERPDIVHIHQLGPISLAALNVIKRLGIKIVQTFHGYYFECPRGSLLKMKGEICRNPSIYCRLYKKIYRNVMKSCDQIVAISSYVKQRLLNAAYDPYTIMLLPNSISSEPENKCAEKSKKMKEILFVGRMVRVKGIHLFLEALTKIPEINRTCTVNLIGEGEDRVLFQKLARSYSLQVNFLGEVPDEVLRSHYKNAWIVVVPSIYPEPLPMVPLEAATYCCPVVASNIGGLSDVVLHGRTGFLFDPNNTNELAKFLEVLVTNEKLAQKMGSEAKYFVREFSNEKKRVKLLKIYKRILSR
jgi:glycosyltransferase involved in cell wall biosynthesis